MRPKQLEFDERPAALAAIFVNIGRRLKIEIVDGDSVTLKLKDVSLIVDQVVSTGASRYRGTIVGFENWLEPTCKDYAIGDKVDFTERQVFVYPRDGVRVLATGVAGG